MNTWQLYPLISAPMPFQLALDELLFQETKIPSLRFYLASEPAVSVGYGTRAEAVRFDEVPVYRRLTGGGIVEHGRDTLFSLVATKEDDESFASVRLSYLKIHEAVAGGLESLGKAPRFYRCDESLPRGAHCFQSPIATDLALKGRKIAGGAQKRSCGRLLHEESVAPIRSKDYPAVVSALREGFARIFKIRFAEADWDPVLLRRASRLAAARYAPEKPGAGKAVLRNEQTRMLAVSA